MSVFIESIGSVAAVLTTISFLPQVIKTYKEKSAENLSMLMLVLLLIGVVLWLIYGLFKNSYPLIIANAVTMILTFLLVFFKIKYSKKL